MSRQRLLAMNMAKGMTKQDAALAAGYSPSTAKQVSNVTKRQSFQDILEEYLPISLVMEKHRVLLEAKRRKRTINKASGVTEEIEEEQYEAVARGVDMAHKLRGSYAAQKVRVLDPLEELSPEEIDQQIAELEEQRHVNAEHRPEDSRAEEAQAQTA